MPDRHPYVGEGADGCRRSAAIDRSEIDTLDRDDPRVPYLEASAAEWDRLADQLEQPDPLRYQVIIDLDLADIAARGKDIPTAVGALAGVMAAQAEDGLWSGGSEGQGSFCAELRVANVRWNEVRDETVELTTLDGSVTHVPAVADIGPGGLTARQSPRRYLLTRLRAISAELDMMLGYWTAHDLPADILHPQEYPFTRSLEDLTAEVHSAVDALGLATGDGHA